MITILAASAGTILGIAPLTALAIYLNRSADRDSAARMAAADADLAARKTAHAAR